MNAVTLMKTTTLACAFALAPALCLAAAPNSTVPGVPDSYTWGASHQAADTLQSISRNARHIALEASSLQSGANSPEARIKQIRAHADRLSRQLQMLEGERSQIVPDGRAAIDQAAPLIAQINADANASGIGAWQHDSSSFNSNLENLASQAHQLARQMRSAAPAARAQNEQMYLAKNAPYLRKNLGMLEIFR